MTVSKMKKKRMKELISNKRKRKQIKRLLISKESKEEREEKQFKRRLSIDAFVLILEPFIALLPVVSQ